MSHSVKHTLPDNIFIICKASPTQGYGHLFRARALAENLLIFYKISPQLYIISNDDSIGRHNILKEKIYKDEKELLELKFGDGWIFIDMLNMSSQVFNHLKMRESIVISISPVFNLQNQVDVLFSRIDTQLDVSPKCQNFYGGIEYCILSPTIKKIPSKVYNYNLASERLNISLSLGGGDAPNRTLEVLKELVKVNPICTFWIFIGQGYAHNVQILFEQIGKEHKHEIVVIKNNRSIWKLLKHTSLLITTSGMTSYEAAYIGLPTLVYYEKNYQKKLVKQLFDKKVAFEGGIFEKDLDEKLANKIAHLSKDHEALETARTNSLSLFSDNTIELLINKLLLI